MMFVGFVGDGQRPNQPEYLNGATCMWGKDLEDESVITVEIAKQILKDGEKEANERFGFEHKFFSIEVKINNKKKATYNLKTNILRILENGLPVYENNNGVICRDSVALADSLL